MFFTCWMNHLSVAPTRQRSTIADLKNLRDQGNTVIVVEHDEEAILEADYVFDLGQALAFTGAKWWQRAHLAKLLRIQNL